MAREASLRSLPRRDPHRPRGGAPRRSRRVRWRVAAWVGVHVLFLAHLAHWRVAGRTLSPLEPSAAGETLELGYVNAGFLLLGVLLVATPFAGGCVWGWACDVVAYQDACAWLAARLGLRLRPVRARLLGLIPLAIAAEMFLPPLWRGWLAGAPPPSLELHLTTDALMQGFDGPLLAALTLAVDGALVVGFLGAKGFCTYGCPYGALFAAADRFAPTRVRATDACAGCGHCTAVCTSNVRVHEEVALHRMVVDPGCMKCLDCVDVCPRGALYVGRGPRPGAGAQKGRRKRRRHDFTLAEELALLALFAGALYAFRGLYAAVSLMLAVGLALLACCAAVLAWRVVSRRDFELQGHALRRGGAWTPAGAGLGLAALAWLALTAHSGVVRRHERGADAELARAAALDRGDARRDDAVRAALAHLEAARDLGLVTSARTWFQLASAHFALGDAAAAEASLRGAIASAPDEPAYRTRLVEVLWAQRRPDDARAELERVLERWPADATALRLRELVDRAR